MKKLIQLFTIALFCSCAEKNTTNEPVTVKDHKTFQIDVSNPKENFEFANSGQHVKLETNKEFLIGEVNKVITYKDRIYVMDNRVTNAVFIFDRNGKAIQKIAKQGEGPNEYLQLSDIVIDKNRDQLCILTRMDKKLFFYDLDGKELLEKVRLRGAYTQMAIADKDKYLFYCANTTIGNIGNLVIWDRENNKTEDYFPIPNNWNSIELGLSAFSTDKSNTTFVLPLDNNIYRYENDSIKTAYTFDLGNANFPEEMKTPEHIMGGINSDELNKLVQKIEFHHLFNDRLYLSFTLKNRVIFVSIDTKTGKYTANEIIGLRFPFGPVAGMDEGNLICRYSASGLNSSFELRKNNFKNFPTDMNKEILDWFTTFMADVEEEDNPILSFYPLENLFIQ